MHALLFSLVAAGSFTSTVPFGVLPPSFVHVPLYLQAAVFPGASPIRASNSIAFVVH
jgi:hypothetical protein